MPICFSAQWLAASGTAAETIGPTVDGLDGTAASNQICGILLDGILNGVPLANLDDANVLA